MQTPTEEETKWEAVAAACDEGRGVPLREFNPDKPEDMNLACETLDVQGRLEQKRLQAYIRHLREQGPLQNKNEEMNEQQKQQANDSEDMKRRIERMEGMMIESQKQEMNEQQKQQANDSEDMKRKIENIEKMMIESKTDDRNMSKANTEFATDLLTGLSISWRNAVANMNVGVGSVVGNFEWEQALLTGGTGKLSENDGTPLALKWLFGKLDQALAVDGKKLGIRDVKGKKLAPIKADRKVANGKSDGCVTDESMLALCERSQESFYTYGMALVEMKTDRTPMNKAQMLLQLAAFSRESVWGQSTILLGTDGNKKWYLVQFEALNSMLITQYYDGRECLNEFESLLKSLKTREAKLRGSKRAKLAPVLEEQFQSEHHLPGASTPGTASLAWTDGAGEGQDAVDKAIENEALLHRLANALAESPLSDGVRPSLPEWSLAKNVVPSYYT